MRLSHDGGSGAREMRRVGQQDRLGQGWQMTHQHAAVPRSGADNCPPSCEVRQIPEGAGWRANVNSSPGFLRHFRQSGLFTHRSEGGRGLGLGWRATGTRTLPFLLPPEVQGQCKQHRPTSSQRLSQHWDKLADLKQLLGDFPKLPPYLKKKKNYYSSKKKHHTQHREYLCPVSTIRN